MSYALAFTDDIVYVRYYGVVDGLDIVRLINDPDFMPNLHKFHKVIYDFSETEEIRLESDEVARFALLGKVETNFVDQVHSIIILSCPRGRTKAEIYQKNFEGTNWQVDIAESHEEAYEFFNAAAVA